MRKLLALASLLGCLADDPSAPRAIQVPDAMVLGPTRLYFRDAANTQAGLPATEQSSRTALVTWPDANTNRMLSTIKGSAQVRAEATSAPQGSAQDHVIRRYVSSPLDSPQPVGGGTIQFNAAIEQPNGLANFKVTGLTIYVWRPSTGAVVGFVKDALNVPSQEPTAINQEQVTHGGGVTSTAVAGQQGDVVVVEVWSRIDQQGSLSFTNRFYYDGATENTTPNAVVSDQAAFIEFSEGLSFAVGHTVPASIDPTGTEDVTVPLQAFLDSVPDNSLIVFPPGSRYRIEAPLVLVDRHGLTIEGRGSEVFAITDGSGTIPPDCITLNCQGDWVRTRSQWQITGGANHRFHGIKVKGANPFAGTSDSAYKAAKEAQHGFWLQGVDGIELDSVTVTDTYGDFVDLAGKPGTLEWTKNVHIHHSHFERNGRQGIAVTRGEDLLFENNYIGQTRRGTFDLEPNSESGGARRITIRNNTIGPGRLKFIAAGGRGSNVGDVLVENNQLQGRSLDLVVGGIPAETVRRYRWTIRNNVSDDTFGSPLALMRFSRIDSLVVTGNVNRLQPGREMVGVYADSVCMVHVSDNTFENAAQEAEINPNPWTCP